MTNTVLMNETLAAKRLALDIVDSWPPATPFQAAAVLKRHPQLRRHKSVVLELACEEYFRRKGEGEPVEPNEFSGQFSEVRFSLRRLLEVHEYLEESGELLPPNQAEWPLPGGTFLDFHLMEELGRGAYSRVFVARQPSLDHREVVVKVCPRGLFEAGMLARLPHPNVVPVYSVDTDPATELSAICMPYLGRATLFDLLDGAFAQGRVPTSASAVYDAISRANAQHPPAARNSPGSGQRTYVDELLRIGAELADGLAFAHSHGVCHGDVKPSNVLLMADATPMLIDFNVAFGHRAPSVAGGTIAYMAPEQMEVVFSRFAGGDDSGGGPPAIDQRADVYSFGATIYELLTGKLPFPDHSVLPLERDDLDELLVERRGPVRPVVEANAWVDRPVADLMASCLCYEPSGRPPSAAAVAFQLRKLRSPRSRLVRWARVHPRRTFLLSAGVMVLPGLLAYRAATPLSAQDELTRAYEAHEGGDWKAAMAAYNRALTIDATNAAAHFGRGRGYLAQNKPLQAAADFAAIEHLDVGSVSACLGYCLSLQRRSAEAAKKYQRAMESGFSSLGLYNNLGYCYYRQGKFAAADDQLQRALALADSSHAVVLNVALVRTRLAMEARDNQERIMGAVAGIQRALDILPASLDLYYDAALAFALAGARAAGEQRERCVQQTLSACEAAVKLGLHPSRLDSVAKILPDLRRTEGLSRIRRCVPGKQASTMLWQHIVDPLEEFAQSHRLALAADPSKL